jgi:hypothetical protein
MGGLAMNVQTGQLNDVKKALGNICSTDCSVIAEGGNDNGKTFLGSFLIEIKRKGTYRFEDGKLLRKVKQ